MGNVSCCENSSDVQCEINTDLDRPREESVKLQKGFSRKQSAKDTQLVVYADQHLYHNTQEETARIETFLDLPIPYSCKDGQTSIDIWNELPSLKIQMILEESKPYNLQDQYTQLEFVQNQRVELGMLQGYYSGTVKNEKPHGIGRFVSD